MVVHFFCACFPLTTENNNVKLPVAERLVLVGDAGPETTRLPQSQSQQHLTLLLVEGHRLTVVLLQAAVVRRAELREQGSWNEAAALLQCFTSVATITREICKSQRAG